MFCVLSRNLKCDLRNTIQICYLQKLFEWFILVIMLDHFIVNFSDRLVLLLANDACSFLIIKWRISVLDLFSDVYDKTSSLMKHLIKVRRLIKTWRKRLIKLYESDSSNLTKKDVISSKLTKALSHQTWDRHLIKLKIVISSNLRSSSHQTFEKKDNLSTFWWAISSSDTWCEKLSLAEDHFRFVQK